MTSKIQPHKTTLATTDSMIWMRISNCPQNTTSTYCEIFATCKTLNYERARSTLRHQKLALLLAYKVKDCFQ